MSVWRLIVGAIFLAVGLGYILCRNRIGSGTFLGLSRLGLPPASPVMLGSTYATIGVIWLVTAFI